MQKQMLIAVTFLLGSSIACAETTPTTATPAQPAKPAAPVEAPATPPETGTRGEMTKDTWLNTIAPMLPSLICKGFMGDPDLKKRLDTIKMSYEQCVNAIPESVNKCKDQLYNNIPNTITNEDAATWGKNLGECIGKDFAMKYLLPK